VALLGEGAPHEGYGSSGEPSVTLELGDAAQLKLAAIGRHVSQTGSAGPFRDWSPEVRDRYLATESYRLARSNLPVPVAYGEATLFDGLP
jgi:LmbE family N-acetylglucosaminyl deacetylase